MNRTFTFELKDDFITLIRLLKATGLAENGSSAKTLVDEKKVMVQGLTVSEYRKKIFPGMLVQVPDFDAKIMVVSASAGE